MRVNSHRIHRHGGEKVQFRGQTVNLYEIAKANGIDYSYLWRIVTGRREPSLEYARTAAAALGMDVYDFLQGIAEKRAELEGQIEQSA